MAGSQEKKAAAAQQAAAQQQAQIDVAAQQAVAEQMAVPAAQSATAAPAAAPALTDEVIAQLQKLGELRAAGVMSEEEFASLKAKLLNG